MSRSDADGHGGRLLGISALVPVPAVGDSVAVNGACLTVVGVGAAVLFQVGPETLAKTNLGELKVGDRVNLEAALRVGDPVGGHFVSGHIDTVGHVADRIPSGDWETVWFAFPPDFSELVVEKGSVAVDGVSLTVVDAPPGRLSVMLIPHTVDHTTLGRKPVGAALNLEFDLLAKHVRRIVRGH